MDNCLELYIENLTIPELQSLLPSRYSIEILKRINKLKKPAVKSSTETTKTKDLWKLNNKPKMNSKQR